MANNYQDVVEQLQAAGLCGRGIDDGLVVGRMMRCRVEGDRERRGWYILHEMQFESGDLVLVGSFGVWRGNDNGAQKIELRSQPLTGEQKTALRKRLAEDRKRAKAARQREADRAAQRAAAAWDKCQPTGDSPYLTKKGVQSHGCRFSPSGALVLPVMDAAGIVHGLQIIRPPGQGRRLGKEFWPGGVAKQGHFMLIGMPHDIVLVAEGYATAASLHEATGLPVAVAFDAGNLVPVVAALHKRYRRTRILVCADDDSLQKCRACKERVNLAEHPDTCPHCGQPHQAKNAGVMSATAAALEVAGGWVKPVFTDQCGRVAKFMERGTRLSDFNDLHAAEGLHVVRQQVEARLSELGWDTPPRAPSGPAPTGGKGKEELKPIASLNQMLKRFALIYAGGGAVFDREEHLRLSLSDMRDACLSRQLHRAWAEHPDREIVRSTAVGFDPAGEDPNITCNLWAGWPTEPSPGRCEKLLDLLRHMCSADKHPEQLYQWVLRWIAYPIQHPGAKMKTALVIHGPQGTGKNMFFEALMQIYGPYGRVIDQNALEDKFNDWASRKLMLIADEVVARSDLYHVKNKLKAFITGDWIRINAKQLAAYDERNHANMVFLSNEAMPVALEEDDRRHAVIWTPGNLGPDFYAAVAREIDQGGIAALHDYLLHLDMADFTTATRPPLTDAKIELVRLGLDSPSRWYYELVGGEVGKIKLGPALSIDAYDCYRTWCARNGVRPAPSAKFVNALMRKHGVVKMRRRYYVGGSLGNSATVLMLAPGDGSLPPPGTNETSWLTDCIEAFKQALRDYREAS